MKMRKMAMIAGLLVAAAASGNGPADMKRPAPATGPDIVSFAGVRNIAFGTTEQELARRGVLDAEPEACGPHLAGVPTADPVFADDRLVLLWANGETSTPEGVHVGTPVAQVRAAYPGARDLVAPRGSYRFDGLLVRAGDRAYLFLHDGRTVRKSIVGYADYAQKLFDEGFGLC